MSGDRVPGDAREIRTAALGAAAVHAIVAGAAILAGIEGTSEWFDQKDYHLPVIERFAPQLPAPPFLVPFRSPRMRTHSQTCTHTRTQTQT